MTAFHWLLTLLPWLSAAQPLGGLAAIPRVSLVERFGSTQLLVVRTVGMNAVSGTLAAYDWNPETKRWVPREKSFPIVVGKNGLAWGEGLHESELKTGTPKREGDGRSPAGLFDLGPAFGYGPKPANVKLGYLRADSLLVCVDDPASRYYNQLVRADTVPRRDWTSAERMRLSSDAYRYGIVVAYNFRKPVAGRGSCLFVHLWGGPSAGTLGCTAMTEARLLDLLGWLDPARRPLLLQVPQADYQRLQTRYDLPE
jgi:D-alanyl-D-alanine dipeptidase